MQTQTKLFFDLVKLIKYLASALVVVSSSPVAGPPTKNKISFFPLSVCNGELLSTLKIITFLPLSKFEIKKSHLELNPISYPE